MAYSLFYGDIHNHCDSSYGHGSVEEALINAALQLDFCSITGHSSWPDMDHKNMPPDIASYHSVGFRKLKNDWKHFVDAHSNACEDGRFVAFPSYESHSFEAGDYVVYHKKPPKHMILPESFSELKNKASDSNSNIFIVPHHIGYLEGFRGIAWDKFDEKASPLVEIISMHGCSESEDAPFPPLHTMGPRSGKNTMQAGLVNGKIFGVTGSTDHHSAHPGSYGYGLTGVWSEGLTMDDLWQAFRARRTYALSGDKIRVGFFINDHPMGSIIKGEEKPPTVNFFIEGEAPLDYVEVLKNNQILKRFSPNEYIEKSIIEDQEYVPCHGKIVLELGWGEKGLRHAWEVHVGIENGYFHSVSPHFRGVDVVDPLEKSFQGYQFTEITQNSASNFAFKTITWGNPTTSTSATQGCVFEIDHDGSGILVITVNGKEERLTLKDLTRSSHTAYSSGFLSPAIRISRLVPPEEYAITGEFEDTENQDARLGDETGSMDSYYLRVRQKNGHWAWTSPIWILG